MRAVVRRPWGRFALGALTIGVLAALSASASYAAAGYLAKQLVAGYAPSLVVGAYEAMFGIVYIAVAIRLERSPEPWHLNRRGLLWALGTGLCLASGVGFFYSALGRTPLSVVSPLVGSGPLFAYLFVLLLLRGTERVTRRVLLGALLVVTGVALIGINNAP